MDIDKLIRMDYVAFRDSRFGSLMDIDKLILINLDTVAYRVLVL